MSPLFEFVMLMEYFINYQIYNEILKCLGNDIHESGGILGKKDNVICAFYHDKNAISTCGEYYPNVNELNTVIDLWYDIGIVFCGIVHSHPNSYSFPSQTDREYVEKLMKANKNAKSFLFPIVVNDITGSSVTLYEYTDKFYKRDITILY